MPTLTFSTSQTSDWTGHSHSATWTLNNNNDYATLRSLSTACVITQVYVEVSSHTDTIKSSFLGISLPTCSYSVTGNSQTLISGSFDIPKKDKNEDAGNHSKTQNVSYTGANFFGSSMANGTFKLSYSASGCDGAYHSQVGASKLKITYSERCYVTFMNDGSVAKAATMYNSGHTLTGNEIPSVSKDGYIFIGWKSSLDKNTYLPSQLPQTNGYDVTYTAMYQPIDYHVGLSAVSSAGSSLDVGNKLTGGGTYQIDDTFAIAADAGDTTVNSNVFLFDYWTFQDANGNDMFLDDSGNATHFNNEALASLTVSADTISAWWPTPASSGEHQGEYWIYGIAHYYQVYDISLNIGDPSDGDPAGVGKNGIVSISVVSDGTTQTYTKDQVLTGSIVARVDNPDVQIHTTFTAANEYQIFSTAFYGVPSGSTAYTKSWQGAAFVVSGTVTTSNWYFCIEAWKRYFDLNMSGDTDGVLKVYSVSSNGTRSLISPTHIPRTTKVEIEADGTLVLQKTHDTAVTSITPNTNTSVANGKGTITSLLQNHTIAVTRTQVNCTMSKIVNSGEPTDETVVRSNSYRYIIAAESGWTISSATLTMRGTQIQSWQNVTSIDYTIQSVTGNCVLTVRRVQDPQAYVTIQTPPSQYGTVDVTSATSILKSQFTGFVIQSITALPAYEVMSATYQWIAGTTIVGTGTIDPTVGATIQYPSATIPSDQDVVLVVDVQYRKNIIYYSHKPNDPKRPQSLWYTPVGQTPQSVTAVFAQTADHKLPILLFGISEDWIFTEQVNQNLSYTADIVRGTLMIESTGDLSSYHSAATSPWADYKDSVSVVTISDGCTGIDPNMFVDMTALETIVVPDNLADTVFPLAANTDERLNIYCRSDDEAANYTFTVEDERLVVSYGDNS